MKKPLILLTNDSSSQQIPSPASNHRETEGPLDPIALVEQEDTLDLWSLRQHLLGHACPRAKPPQTLRLFGVNFGRYPVFARADRSTQFLANVKDYNPDVVLGTDLGVFWKNLDPADS